MTVSIGHIFLQIIKLNPRILKFLYNIFDIEQMKVDNSYYLNSIISSSEKITEISDT